MKQKPPAILQTFAIIIALLFLVSIAGSSSPPLPTRHDATTQIKIDTAADLEPDTLNNYQRLMVDVQLGMYNWVGKPAKTFYENLIKN